MNDPTDNQKNVKKLLMSRDNHEGMELEDLFDNIIAEIEAKTNYLFKNDMSEEDKDLAGKIIVNNKKIIDYLRMSICLQRNSMMLIEHSKGPNKGPSNPRI